MKLLPFPWAFPQIPVFLSNSLPHPTRPNPASQIPVILCWLTPTSPGSVRWPWETPG